MLLAAVGAVWFAQGIGVLKGSVMTGEAFWAVVGAPMFVIGVFLVVSSGRRARSAPGEPAASSRP